MSGRQKIVRNGKVHSGEDVKLTGIRSSSSLRTTSRLDTAPRTMAERLTIVLPHLLAIGVYLLLAIFVTWPLVRHFTTGVVGADEGVDAYQHTWHFWWTAHALLQGKLPFYTSMLYYPHGIDLFWQTLGFSQGVTVLPVTLTLGPIAAVNWTIFSSFVIGGYAVFLFTRYLTQSVPAALVSGVIYVFSPYHLQRVMEGSIELASIHWMAIYVFILYLFLEHPSWRRALLTGIVLLWVSLGSWYYGLFSVMFTGCAILVWMLFAGRTRSVRLALWGMVPLVLWGAVLAPRILTVSQVIDQEQWDLRASQMRHSADIIDFFLPNPIHPIWGQAVQAARQSVYPDLLTFWNVALGWVGLFLALFGAVMLWQRTKHWVLLLGATMLLAMGPALRIAGIQTNIPLPFALLQGLPGIRISQRPSHMAVLSSLMVAILAAYGFIWLTRRVVPHFRWSLAAVMIVAVIALDGYTGPLDIVHRKVHPFYATLPQPDDGALMALPMYVNVNRGEHILAQTVHHWPIFAGYVARPPAYPFVEYTPGVRELRTGQVVRNDIVSPGWPESGRRALADYAIRYVTLDLTSLTGSLKLRSGKSEYFAQVRTLLDELGVGPAIVADASLEAYAIPPTWPVEPLGFLGKGWQSLEVDATHRWRWMGDEAEIKLVNPLDHPVIATVTMHMLSYQQSRSLQVALNETNLGQVNVEAKQPELRVVHVLLPPGEHALVLHADATSDPARNDIPISIRFFYIDFRFTSIPVE